MYDETYGRAAFDLYAAWIDAYNWHEGSEWLDVDRAAVDSLLDDTWSRVADVYPDEDRDIQTNPFALFKRTSLFWNMSSEYDLQGAMAYGEATVSWNNRYWDQYFGATLPTNDEAHQLLSSYERMDSGMQGYFQIYVLATEVITHSDGGKFWPLTALRVMTFEPSDWHPLCGCGTAAG